MSPEGDDGHLSVQSLLVFREVDGEESTDSLSRQSSRCLTENAAEHRGEELNLKGRKDQKCDNSPHLNLLPIRRNKKVNHLMEDAQSLQTLSKPAGSGHTFTNTYLQQPSVDYINGT